MNEIMKALVRRNNALQDIAHLILLVAFIAAIFVIINL